MLCSTSSGQALSFTCIRDMRRKGVDKSASIGADVCVGVSR